MRLQGHTSTAHESCMLLPCQEHTKFVLQIAQIAYFSVTGLPTYMSEYEPNKKILHASHCCTLNTIARHLQIPHTFHCHALFCDALVVAGSLLEPRR